MAAPEVLFPELALPPPKVPLPILVSVLTCSLIYLLFLYPAPRFREGMSSSSEIKKNLNPEDLRLYSLALNNRWTRRELYHHVAPELPIFVYDSLMLPWVLARVLGLHMNTKEVEDTATYMTRATLRHHFRVRVIADQSPVVLKTQKDAAVDGMLVAGMKPEIAARIEEYVGLGCGQLGKEIEGVEVQTKEGEDIIVCAYVYVWKGDTNLLEPKNWSPLEYMRSRAAPVEEKESPEQLKTGAGPAPYEP